MGWNADFLQRFRDGAPDALAEVYRQHAEGLARALRAAAWRGGGYAHLRSAVEIDNALLETFARAFEPRARAVYDGVRPYAHYLMGIARNVVLESGRQRELAVGLAPQDEAGVLDWELGTAGAGGGDLGQELEDREVTQLLEDFKAGLAPEERRLFELRFAEGLAQERAAQEVGLTRIQVRRREMHLKRRLLDFLQARGYLTDVRRRGWGFWRARDEADEEGGA